jgi:hypothetical protein
MQKVASETECFEIIFGGILYQMLVRVNSFYRRLGSRMWLLANSFQVGDLVMFCNVVFVFLPGPVFAPARITECRNRKSLFAGCKISSLLAFFQKLARSMIISRDLFIPSSPNDNIR